VTPVRLLALLEANSVTGPSKNLFQFACCARSGQAGPPVEVAIALFLREGVENLCLEAARQAGPVYPITEKSRFDFGVIPQLRSAIREFQPDVIQSHAIKSHLLVRVAGFHTATPWVAFHHGYTWPDLRMRMYNQLDRWSLPAARQVLTVSVPFREELIRHGVARHRIEIIHNAIDPQWGSGFRSPQAGRELRAALGIGPDERVILIAGRLSREKDHQTAVRAVHRLPAELVGTRLSPREASVASAMQEAHRRSFGEAGSQDQVGQLDGGSARFGRTYAGEPDELVAALAGGAALIFSPDEDDLLPAVRGAAAAAAAIPEPPAEATPDEIAAELAREANEKAESDEAATPAAG